MKKHGCPICKKERARKSENAQFPFCSVRCKSIDLSRWLDQSYTISSPAPHLQSMDHIDF